MNAVKKVFLGIVCAIMVCAIVIGSGFFSAFKPQGTELTIETGEQPALSSGVAFEVKPLAANASDVGTQRVTAQVTPAGTALAWSLSWQNAGDTRTMSEYLSIEVVSVNSIDLTCHQRYEGTAILRCEFASDPSVYDTATVTAPPVTTDSDGAIIYLFTVDTSDAVYQSEVSALEDELSTFADQVTVYEMSSDQETMIQEMEAVRGTYMSLPTATQDRVVSVLFDHNMTFCNLTTYDGMNLFEEGILSNICGTPFLIGVDELVAFNEDGDLINEILAGYGFPYMYNIELTYDEFIQEIQERMGPSDYYSMIDTAVNGAEKAATWFTERYYEDFNIPGTLRYYDGTDHNQIGNIFGEPLGMNFPMILWNAGPSMEPYLYIMQTFGLGNNTYIYRTYDQAINEIHNYSNNFSAHVWTFRPDRVADAVEQIYLGGNPEDIAGIYAYDDFFYNS